LVPRDFLFLGCEHGLPAQRDGANSIEPERPGAGGRQVDHPTGDEGPGQMPSMTKKKAAARRKVLNILPRKMLEEFSRHDRPHMQTKPQLIALALANWDEDEIRDAIDVILLETADRSEP
jgi:hypothetical protein